MSIEALAPESVGHHENPPPLPEPGNVDAWLDTLTSEVRQVEPLRTRWSNQPDVKQAPGGNDATGAGDFDKVGAEIMYSWIKPAEYGARFTEVNALVARFPMPFDLRCFLDEARQCYALGQFSAVQSLCRTILETAVNDIANRTGKMPQTAVEKDGFRESPLKERIRLVAGDSFEQIHQHYHDLCKVVPGFSTSATSGALGTLTRTVGFVQHLYGRHQIHLKNRNP